MLDRFPDIEDSLRILPRFLGDFLGEFRRILWGFFQFRDSLEMVQSNFKNGKGFLRDS